MHVSPSGIKLHGKSVFLQMTYPLDTFTIFRFIGNGFSHKKSVSRFVNQSTGEIPHIPLVIDRGEIMVIVDFANLEIPIIFPDRGLSEIHDVIEILANTTIAPHIRRLDEA